VGGIPGAGATKGTVVNINSGGRTRLSGATHGLFLLAVLLGLGTLAAYIPLSVLAGLLIPIGFKIIDKRGLKHFRHIPRADAAVLIIVLLITTFGSLIQAVGVGIALASLLFMKKAGDIGEDNLSVEAVEDLKEEKPWQDEQAFYEKYKGTVLIKHLDGPLFFGFTAYFKAQVKKIDDGVEALIIRLDKVPYIDQSGLYALEDGIFNLCQRDIKVLLVNVEGQPMDMLRAIDLVPDLVPEEQIFPTVRGAFDYLQKELA
jgi:SulP family sulfate permease